MTQRIFPDTVHTLFVTWLLDDNADKFLRAIIDLSKDSDFYTHDSIIAGYEHTAPLHFDFLETPILFRYTTTGVDFNHKYQLKQVRPSQSILYDLGRYAENMDVPDNYVERNIIKVEQLNLPTIYFVRGKKTSIRLGVLRSKINIATPDNLMVYDNSEPNSLKDILTKIIQCHKEF